MRRTTFARIGSAGLALLLSLSAAAAAEIKLVAPSAPGSGWDQLAQVLREALAEVPAAPSIRIRNVPGGAGTVGLAEFGGSTDNDELLVTGLTMLDASLITRSHVTLDRLTPIARLTAEPFAVAVPASSAVKSLDDLRTAMRAGAGLIWAGGPVGGIDHVGVILLARAVGAEPAALNYVPFLTSAEAAAAAAEERVQATTLAVSALQAPGIAERVRILGVASERRIAGLDAPTLAEGGIPLDYANWRGLLARSGLPAADQARHGALVAQASRARSWREGVARKGWRDQYLGPEEFGIFLRDEQIRVKEALKAAGLLKRGQD